MVLLEAPKNILGVVDFFLSKSITCELVLYMCVCVCVHVCVFEKLASFFLQGIGVVAMNIYISINTLNFVVIELYFVTSENWPMSTLRNRIPVTCFFLRSEIQDLSPTRD